MTKVAVVGAGLIGRAWCISFARAGHSVVLVDREAGALETAISFIKEILAHLEQSDLLNGAEADTVAARVVPCSGLAEALSGAGYVQESTPENLDSKRTVFSELDRLAPADCILASSTSGILPSAFTQSLEGRGRCLVAHPINPPYLVPAVELVPAPWTTKETISRARNFLADAGQTPIVMQHEIDGFIMNRMQGALLDEAFRLVDGGYASVEDIDIGIREGIALRWSFIGPFETIDLNAPGGVREYVERYGPLYRKTLDDAKDVDWQGPVLDEIERQRRARLGVETLAERQAWRDRRLMALAQHKRKAARNIGD